MGKNYGLPDKQGLYDPRNEHDACGVGFVANIKGQKSHDIIQKGISVLARLEHRGATNSDAATGDGAGISIQMPHDFMVKAAREAGLAELPAAGLYGVGVFFLSQDAQDAADIQKLVEAVVKERNLRFIGWRDVPTDNSQLGALALEAEPRTVHLFVGAADDQTTPDEFELQLYLLRKVIENRTYATKLRCYIPSFSSRLIVYKGLLTPPQIPTYYRDLADPSMTSALALVHQRFSTNTFPTWERAHPYRMIAHNGEINTLQGNTNWLKTREALFESDLLGDDVKNLSPVIVPGGSDSMAFDNVLEMLTMTGRDISHAVMMMVPEAWETAVEMPDYKKAFYEYHTSLIEPWDGPAAIAFTNGNVIGAFLDRNGLRPARYVVTKDDLVVMASETGVLDFPIENVASKGRLEPGKMFLVNLEEGRIVSDEEVKYKVATAKPYREWLTQNHLHVTELPEPPADSPQYQPAARASLLQRQQTFGYTAEELRVLMLPMALNGEEATGSMGNDTPLAVLSERPQLLYNYFKQLFAQVTNPPIDPIREDLVMSLTASVGTEHNMLTESPQHCRALHFDTPVLTNRELEQIRHIEQPGFKTCTIPMLFKISEGVVGLEAAIQALCDQSVKCIVEEGSNILILSDRGVDAEHAPIPALLATAAVHHHLIRKSLRTRCGLLVESGEPREVMHFALLGGYGASGINPYLAFEGLAQMRQEGILPDNYSVEKYEKNFVKAVSKGLLKIFSKMGISTFQSYQGAQIFEAIGLEAGLVDRYFVNTPSRIGGIGVDGLVKEVKKQHDHAFAPKVIEASGQLYRGGQYQWRKNGEHHQYDPNVVAKLQHATAAGDYKLYKKYAAIVNNESERLLTLRGLLKIKKGNPISLDEVEPVEKIVKRFCTGAMSFGSISKEAHETLAIAMNRLGGKSNTGEGGEDPARYTPDANGDSRRSAIKQIASARFGVDSHYLVNADELQIKMAQGAKPGEGGQLPGHKVDENIARVRNSVPGVTLISPPPHHDIYSIEDLAQLIFDLKNVNPRADVSVKLVAEVGVGTVAAGVAKTRADAILISGHDGGTGASPLTSIKHAGIPWEIGLAETHQVLVMNNLRGRVRLQTDGQLKTGRDVVIATLLGAEEYGFSTAPLVAMGCILMRKCHMNTCPVGIATQDKRLREKFAGTPEQVINFFQFIAQEVREIMAELGVRSLDELVGRADLLEVNSAVAHYKAQGLDFSNILYQPEVSPEVKRFKSEAQDHQLRTALDNKLIELCQPALENGEKVTLDLEVRNRHRSVGAMLGGEVSRRYGGEGLPEDTINITFKGSAGQSFGAFVPRGISLTLVGDANDYVGKGLSGGKLVVRVPEGATFEPDKNIIIGNTTLYGAIRGEAYFNGVAGERFAVRNSGATTVVEGVGDHGCEYMTGGRVVVLGRTGRNFGAGMSGGVAYVLDEEGLFEKRYNPAMVDLERGLDPTSAEAVELKALIERHYAYTGSPKAASVLANWEKYLPRFVKVMPREYRRALEQLEAKKNQAAAAILTIPAKPALKA
jgi:glutamate synthase (NADPH) large chain